MVACGGLGGVISIYDLRQLKKTPLHSIIDPFLQHIGEFSVSPKNDLIASGKSGFTLWKIGGKSGLTFRGTQDGEGIVRSSFVGSDRAISTNSTGRFQEWSIKKQETKSNLMRTVAVPPLKDSVTRLQTPGASDSASVIAGATAAMTPTPTGAHLSEWDWDFDFQDWSKSHQSSADEVSSSPSKSPFPNSPAFSAQAEPSEHGRKGRVFERAAGSATGPSTSSAPGADDLTSLPIKDLDDLIGYYLS